MQALRREIDAAAARGLDQRMALSVEPYAAFDPADLARRLGACRGGGVMGVAVVAVDAPAVRDAIARLVADGVAVVTIVSDATPSRRTCFIGPDNVAAGRVAAKIAVPAILFFPTSGLFSFMAPFTLGAVVALALAFLILARLVGDRTILRYDAETLTVRGLLGEATILWADVGDVAVRKAAWWDLRVMFTSGCRRNLVVLGRVNRLGGPDTLYIPIDLLGLDAPALARLVTQLLVVHIGGPRRGSAGRIRRHRRQGDGARGRRPLRQRGRAG
jgi:hypothetical protein